MRVSTLSKFTNWRPRSAFTGLAVYGLTIVCLCSVLTISIRSLVRHAEGPVSGLMQLGDAVQIDVATALAPVTRSAVLEGEAWIENLRTEYQGRDRSRPKGLPSSSGLFGQGGNESAAPKPDESLNDGRRRTAGNHNAHRTVCVRLCDGYFWPVSYATSEDQFERDEGVCEKSCASPAKLYVYENPGQEPEQMVSLKGQPYAKLSTAFQFRTKFDQSCKCSPHPWEQEAMDRHRRYAEDADKKKLTRKAEANPAAGKENRSKGKKTSNTDPVQAAAAAAPSSPEAPSIVNATTPSSSVRFTPGPAFISAGKPTTGEGVSGEMIADSGVSADTSEQEKSEGPKPASKRLAAGAAKASGGKAADKARAPETGLMRLGAQTPSRTAVRYVEYASTRQTRDWRVAIFTPR
jgi:Protein of unknown function (DUF2865)